MAVGIGGLLMRLTGQDPSAQLGRALAGPQPNPQPAPGGGQGPDVGSGGVPASATANVPPSAPQQPQAQTYAPDPTNARTIDKLLSLYQNEATANDINRNIALMGSAFGTAQQQHDATAAIAGMPQGGSAALGAIGDVMKIQQESQAQQEHDRFMASAAGLGASLGLDKETTIALANSGKLPEFIIHRQSLSDPTTIMKDAEAATQAYKSAHPEATTQQIADYKANLLAGGMGGSDLEQRQYLAEKSSGATTDDFATWKAKHAAAATGMQAQAKDVQEFKNTAVSEYTPLHSKLTDMQGYIDTLNKDPEAAQAALQTFLPTTGKWGALMPESAVPQNVKNAAIALNKVRSGLTGASLTDVKNLRNRREFDVLGQAATAGLDAAASPEEFKQALANLNDRSLDAQATLEMTMGHKLTGTLVGHGNRDLLNKNDQYYQGSTEEQPANINSPEDIAKLQHGQAFIIPSGAHKGEIGYAP